jgi:hypothetical protein
MRAAGEVGSRSGCLARGRAAVPGRDQGDLAAEPGQGLLVVTDQVLAVALVTLVVVVLAGVGVVLAAGHDGPGDADQDTGDRDCGLLLLALADGMLNMNETCDRCGPAGPCGFTARPEMASFTRADTARASYRQRCPREA